MAWDEMRYTGEDTADNQVSTSNVTSDADGSILERLEYVQSAVAGSTGIGVQQMGSTTIDLAQAAASYDLFTGSAQMVVVDKLIIRLPNVNVSDDATITSISIQTDDTTAQIFISTGAGAKANLTAESQLSGDINGIIIAVGSKIQLTIAGGAADATTTCNVVVEFRAVVAGGTLV